MQNSWYIKTLEPIQIIKVKKIEKVITSSSLNLYRPHIPSQLPNVWRSIPPANFKIQITKIKNQHEYSKTLLAKSLKKKKKTQIINFFSFPTFSHQPNNPQTKTPIYPQEKLIHIGFLYMLLLHFFLEYVLPVGKMVLNLIQKWRRFELSIEGGKKLAKKREKNSS